MKRLILVRHGQTEWNADRRLQGQTDITLNDRGRGQARALAPLVADLAPDHSVTSDLKRAVETAELLGMTAIPDVALREQELGVWTGRAIADILIETPEDYRNWRGGSFVPEGAESWDRFRTRVRGALDAALSACNRTAVIVCHGGVIRAALDATLDLTPARIIPVGPGSLTILAFPDAQARLEAFNVRAGSLELNAPD